MNALAYRCDRGQQISAWDTLIEEFLVELAAAGRPSTTISLRRDQLRHVGNGLGLELNQVTTRSLLGWFAAQPWALETRRSYRSAVRTFFAWAHQQGHVEADPADGLPVIHAAAGVPRPAPDEVYTAALDAATPEVRLMLRLAAECGLRRGEIARLRCSDVAGNDGSASLLVHGKGGKDRLIPISGELAREICHAGDGWLFPNARGGHLSAKWVGKLCAAAMPGQWTLHSLRHRFASRAYARSHDLRAVQILLGHSSPAITQRYVAVGEADLRAVMMGAS